MRSCTLAVASSPGARSTLRYGVTRQHRLVVVAFKGDKAAPKRAKSSKKTTPTTKPTPAPEPVVDEAKEAGYHHETRDELRKHGGVVHEEVRRPAPRKATAAPKAAAAGPGAAPQQAEATATKAAGAAVEKDATPAGPGVHHETREEMQRRGAVVREELGPRRTHKKLNEADGQ